MKRKLSERAAWLWVAKFWGRTDEMKIDDQGMYYLVINKTVRAHGLCFTVAEMNAEELITRKTRDRMLAKIDAFMERRLSLHNSFYLYPLTKAGGKRRAALCRKFAEQCRKGK